MQRSLIRLTKGTYPRQDAVKRIWQEPRARRQLKQPMLSRNMFRILRVELTQVLHAVHELGHACRDMVVAIEADRPICNRF